MLPQDLKSTIAITETHIVTAGNVIPTPPVVLSHVGGMLDWLESRMPCPEIVCLVDRDVMTRHGMPASAGPTWTGLDDVRKDGWKVADLAAWSSYTRGNRHAIHVAHLPWIEPDRSPLMVGDLLSMENAGLAALCARHDLFHALVGLPYRGTPGMAGHALLRHMERTDARRPTGTASVAWRPDLMPRAQEVPTRVTRDGLERDYTKTWTPGTLPLDDVEPVTLDANMQYLAAAAAVDVARGPLEHREHRGGLSSGDRDRKLSGYWKVELSAWNDGRMPDPAGYPHAGHRAGAPRWVTSPTLDLLDELTARGEYGGYVVVESYTAPGARVLRRWAETIRDAIRLAESATQEQNGMVPDPVLRRALKMTYAESIGLFGRAGGRVFRPDWQSAIIGRARSILWRKMWTAGTQEGIWPLAINVDAVTYPRAPRAFAVAPGQLGAFKAGV